MPSPEAMSHRGLALMEALVDSVQVSSNAGGTTVVLEQSLVPAAPRAMGRSTLAR
jgi:hypothetical protein